MKATKKRKTISERRVAVFKDAIKQIKAEKYIVATGDYVHFRKHGIKFGEAQYTDAQAQLHHKKTECRVCADGALVCSLARLENNLSIRELWNAKEKLLKLLPGSQIDLIEGFFETSTGLTDYSPSWRFAKYRNKIDAWREKYPNAKERAIAIFRNAIRNNGIFKP